MSLHDAYARLTPFEIAFPEGREIDGLVEAIREEVSGRGVDPSLPGVFHTLGSVEGFLRALLPPGAAEAARHQYGALVFQAAHFVAAGRPTYLLEAAAVRRLVDGPPGGEPRPPSVAGYVQLPQHMVWMSVSDADVPESLDGLFWTIVGDSALHVLPVTAVLAEAASFRTLPLPELPLRDVPRWLTSAMREGGGDFTSSLPGHDLDGLYSVETAGEVLKLVSRFFAHVEAGAPLHDGPRAAQGSRGPRPSSLPYARVGAEA